MRRRHDDRGQTTAEYAGILALVAAIVLTLAVTDVGALIRGKALAVICQIAGGECDTTADETAEEPRSPYCINGSDANRFEAKAWISARWFKAGALGIREHRIVELPDGTYQASIRYEAGAFVGPGLSSKAPVDGDGRLTAGWTATFNPSTKAEAEQLLREYNEADARTANWLAQDGIPPCLMPGCIVGDRLGDFLKDKVLGEDAIPNYYEDIDTPGLRSETYDAGFGGRVNVSTDAFDKTPEAVQRFNPSARLEVTSDDRLGITDIQDGPDDGGKVVFYESEDGFSGNATFGPLVARSLGGSVKGRTRIAVSIDEHGNPTKLTVVQTGEVAASDGTKTKIADEQTFGKVAGKVPFLEHSSEATSGTGKEITTEVDLTDPELQRQAKIALTGRDPSDGADADRTDAAEALGDAVRDSTTVGIRNYDFDSEKETLGVDLVVVGGQASFEDSSQTTTGYELYDPATGEWRTYDRCPGSTGGGVTPN